MGGFAGVQDAPCGALSATVMAMGLLHRSANGEAGKLGRRRSRSAANALVEAFKARFGKISCRELVGFDFSQPGAYQKFQESGSWEETCKTYVEFVIEKFYAQAEGDQVVPKVERATIYMRKGCRFCEEAKRDLAERGIPYVEIDVETDPEGARQWERLVGGERVVPVIVMGDEVKIGIGGG